MTDKKQWNKTPGQRVWERDEQTFGERAEY